MSSCGDTLKKSGEVDASNNQNNAESQKQADKMNKSGESQGACYWYVHIPICCFFTGNFKLCNLKLLLQFWR